MKFDIGGFHLLREKERLRESERDKEGVRETKRE
jgi:hypothetical protein